MSAQTPKPGTNDVPTTEKVVKAFFDSTSPNKIESFKKLKIEYRDLYPGEENLIKKLAPRRYQGHGNYDEPSMVGRHLASVVINILNVNKHLQGRNHEGSLREQMLHVADRLALWNVPVYYVGENLFDALVRTDLPDDITPGQLKWPVPAMMLMIPLGKLGTSKFNYTTLVLTKHDDEYDSPLTGERVTLEAPFVRVLAFGPSQRDNGDAQYAIVQAMSPMDRTVKQTVEFKLEQMHDLRVNKEEASPQNQSEADQVSTVIFTFALKLLMVMNARPELLEKEPVVDRPERKNKKTGKVEREALWSPNFLGRHYKRPVVPSTNATSDDAKRRMHLRRGHMRWQAYGPQHSLRRLQWIEECWINLDEELE